MGILGVLRRHRIPLTMDTHTATIVNIKSNNNSRSNNSSSKGGRRELAQSNTKLRWTYFTRMQGTMKNLIFVAGYVRCAITRKACCNGVHRFGFSVHPSLPLQYSGPRGGGQLGTTEVQNSFSQQPASFTQQPKSVMWHLQHSLHNTSRHGTMQCQETCPMATDTINLPDAGGMRGRNCKCNGTQSMQNICPLLRLLWLNDCSLGNQIHSSQLLLVCPNNVWPVSPQVGQVAA